MGKSEKRPSPPVPHLGTIHRKPDPGDVPKYKRPVGPSPSEPQRFAFSFRYFQQGIKFFGLSAADKKWFISLLERMKTIGTFTVDDFIKNARPGSNFRFHPIDWKAKNCPIKHLELDWVDKEYLTEEYPLYQISISTGQGRIVGFFDEQDVFNVVLLDHDHNLQPSKKNNYQLTPNKYSKSEYELLAETIQRAVQKKSPDTICAVYNEIKNTNDVNVFSPIMLRLSAQHQSDAEYLIENGVADNVQSIFEAGVNALLDEKDATSVDTE